MGHQAIILMVITGLAGSILIYAGAPDAPETDIIQASQQAKNGARKAAMKGLSQTLFKLDAAESWWNESDFHLNLNRFDTGYYWTRVVLHGPDLVDVVATGMMKYHTANGMPGDTIHIIQVRYKRNRSMGPGRTGSASGTFSVTAYSEW